MGNESKAQNIQTAKIRGKSARGKHGHTEKAQKTL